MRHAILRVHVGFLLRACKESSYSANRDYNVELIANALPEDAKFVQGGHDYHGNLYLVLESESFRDLKEGDEIPVLSDPMFNRAYKQQ